MAYFIRHFHLHKEQFQHFSIHSMFFHFWTYSNTKLFWVLFFNLSIWPYKHLRTHDSQESRDKLPPLMSGRDDHRHRRRRHAANCFWRSLFKATLSMLDHDARRPVHRTTNLHAHLKLMRDFASTKTGCFIFIFFNNIFSEYWLNYSTIITIN